MGIWRCESRSRTPPPLAGRRFEANAGSSSSGQNDQSDDESESGSEGTPHKRSLVCRGVHPSFMIPGQQRLA